MPRTRGCGESRDGLLAAGFAAASERLDRLPPTAGQILRQRPGCVQGRLHRRTSRMVRYRSPRGIQIYTDAASGSPSSPAHAHSPNVADWAAIRQSSRCGLAHLALSCGKKRSRCWAKVHRTYCSVRLTTCHTKGNGLWRSRGGCGGRCRRRFISARGRRWCDVRVGRSVRRLWMHEAHARR